jgi:hypothetical protein
MAGFYQDGGREIDVVQSDLARCANSIDQEDVFAWNKIEAIGADFDKQGELQGVSTNCVFYNSLDTHVKTIDYLDFPAKRLMVMICAMLALPIVSIVIWTLLIYIVVLTL